METQTAAGIIHMLWRSSPIGRNLRGLAPNRRLDLEAYVVGHAGHLRATGLKLLMMIRIDTAWLAVEPLDMRAGTDTALARVVRGSVRLAHTTPTGS